MMLNSCCEKHRRYDGLKLIFIGFLILVNTLTNYLNWPLFISLLITVKKSTRFMLR
jgi:hypothetical protein